MNPSITCLEASAIPGFIRRQTGEGPQFRRPLAFAMCEIQEIESGDHAALPPRHREIEPIFILPDPAQDVVPPVVLSAPWPRLQFA